MHQSIGSGVDAFTGGQPPWEAASEDDAGKADQWRENSEKQKERRPKTATETEIETETETGTETRERKTARD